MDFIQLAMDSGAYKAEVIRQEQIILHADFRKICQTNSCGNYGKCYMCPPDIGPIDDLMAKVQQYDYALFYQTVGKLEDSFDYEGMVEAGQKHMQVCQRIHQFVRTSHCDYLHLAGGGCKLCETCAKLDNLPCRHPENALGSLSAYGVDVYQTTQSTNLKYINGQNTVTYFGMLLYKGFYL